MRVLPFVLLLAILGLPLTSQAADDAAEASTAGNGVQALPDAYIAYTDSQVEPLPDVPSEYAFDFPDGLVRVQLDAPLTAPVTFGYRLADASSGLVLGNVRHPAINRDRNLLGDVDGYVPASFSYLDDRFVLHVNVGVLRDRHARRDRITWGIGSESQLSDRTWLIAETFGQNTGRPFLQVGVRHWIVPNHVQIDTTYGDRLGSATRERWFSVGLRWLSPAFLP